PWNTWARLTNQICRERPLNAIGYGEPQGEAVLRRTIADYLATARGIACSAEQIVVLAGSEQSLEFMIGQIGSPGDAAWVEEPAGPYVRHVLRAAGLVPVPIRVDAEGLDVAQGLRPQP